tara:strand:+ start:2684 stop:3037 length:354 start_codon:yes stop_codon:yes gene_type:complete
MKKNIIYTFLNKYKFIILLILLILIALCYNTNTLNASLYNENFKLHTVRDTYCEDKNLKKAYGPTMCIFEDGQFDLHKNCRCIDPYTGFCKECYPRVDKSFATLVSKRKWRKMLRES